MIRIMALAVLLTSGGLALGETIQAPATEPYVDIASGLVFPASAGAFQRTRLDKNGQGGITAGYSHAAPERIAATVSVTKLPAGDEACGKAVDADRAIAAKRQGVVFDLVPPPVAGWETGGYGANGTGSVGGQEHNYYCRDGWMVQFAFQHSPEVEAEALETAFLAGFPLPEKH